MSSTAKRIKTEEDAEPHGKSVKYLTINPEYVQPDRNYPPINYPQCDEIQRAFEESTNADKNLYEGFAFILMINTKCVYQKHISQPVQDQVINFLTQVYFIIHHYKENSLPILERICKALQLQEECSDEADSSDLSFIFNGAKKEVDTFASVYNYVSLIIQMTRTTYFPGHTVFTTMTKPFKTNDKDAVKVRFNPIICTYNVKLVQNRANKGISANKTTFPIPYIDESTAYSDEYTLKAELNKFISYNGEIDEPFADVVWRDVDIAFTTTAEEAEYVHGQAQVEVERYNYVKLDSVIIYERSESPDKFNMKSFTSSKRLSFSYDKILQEAYLNFATKIFNRQQ